MALVKGIQAPHADASAIADLQRELQAALDEMAGLVPDVGMSKQVIEFNGEQRKRVLALAAVPLIKAGQSSAAADTEARAGESYGAALKELAKQLATAEKTIAQWTVAKLRWETARSLLSMEKETIRQL